VKKRNNPPKILEIFLQSLLSHEDRESLLGDFKEMYDQISNERGVIRALCWYVFHIIKLMPAYVENKIYWSAAMFRNYLKIALRNMKRHKTFSIINISGLIVGLTCFILIFLYVRYEKSYDTFHENSDRIFRVATQDSGNMAKGNDTWASTSAALAPMLMDEFPEVRAATRFSPVDRLLLTKEDKSFYERGLFADEYFFDVFSFQLIRGNKKRILDNPDSIVISKRIAMKFFGNENPVGKTLNCSLGDMEVVGIVENIPKNSHIQFDWLISFKQVKASIEADRNPQFFWWGAINYYTYCLLKNESFKEPLENKIAASMNKKYKDFGWEDMRYLYHLQPLISIHLQSHLNWEFSVNNSDKLILLFSVIAVFILAIACINSMNLSSALAAKRMKEIGIRKVVGGQRYQLFLQFTGESLLFSTWSLFSAVGLVHLLLPGFNRFVERSIEFGAVIESPFVLSMLAVLVGSGFLAGLYPAAVLSSFKPAHTLKGKTGVIGRRGSFRNLLVMLQFSITIALIISSFVMFMQIRYIQEKPLGYDREHVVIMRMTDPGIRKNFAAFKNTLLQNTKVNDITTSERPPTQISNIWGGGKFKTDNGVIVGFPTNLLWIDFNFLDFYRMDLLKGRTFSKTYGTDPANAVIVNETFVRKLNWSNPVGKKIQIWNKEEKMVVGVVKDFHFQSMHNEIKPILIFCRPNNNYIQIRIRSENIPETLGHIRKTFESFRTRYPFEYSFLDDNFNQMYNSERKLGQMLVSFSGLAVFIACLGIFGLASFTAERRTKEIGIRKVLGASVPIIIFLLSEGFLKWVIIANLISWPVAYYAMHKWLQRFAYRIDLGIGIFILSGVAALCIALLTVSFQTIKAATANPVDSLRYE
jgi:putative ABC transport system permease protein